MYNDIYKREKKYKQKTKNIYIYISTVAIVPLGIVATVQNLKIKNKKVAHQNYTVDEQCNTLCEHWPNTIAAQPLFIYLIELKKKSTY